MKPTEAIKKEMKTKFTLRKEISKESERYLTSKNDCHKPWRAEFAYRSHKTIKNHKNSTTTKTD